MEQSRKMLVPGIPNYLLVANSNPQEVVDICEFSESQLREIGAEWIEKLVYHAKKRKSMKKVSYGNFTTIPERQKGRS